MKKSIGLVFLVFIMFLIVLLSGCALSSTLFPPTSTPTPIGANLTPVAIIASSDSQRLGIVDIFLTDAQEKVFEAKETIPPVFSSGIEDVSVVIIFDSTLPDGTSFEWKITRAGEVVQMSGFSTMLSKSYGNGVKVIIPFRPADGQFPDGIYQATLSINESPYAELNWIVGVP